MDDFEDPVVRSSRREALFVFVVWLAAMIYTVGYCTYWGYDRPLEEISYSYGFPSWFFFGVVVPWVVCLFVTWWFAYGVMQDDPLGENTELVAGERSHDA